MNGIALVVLQINYLVTLENSCPKAELRLIGQSSGYYARLGKCHLDLQDIDAKYLGRYVSNFRNIGNKVSGSREERINSNV